MKSKSQVLQVTDLFVGGFLAHTFSPQDAYNFFVLLLRTQNFLQQYRVSYSHAQGLWYIIQSVPSPSPRAPSQDVSLPLDFSVKMSQGSVVPQRRWTPADEVDIRRHVEEATLQLPVFFVNRNGGIGFSLPDILQGRDHDLHHRDSQASLGGRSTTHIRINWPGYAYWRRQIPTRDETYLRNPITVGRFMRHVGTSVNYFMNHCSTNGPGADPRWGIGPHGITQHHVKVIGAVRVSAGSWQPIIQLTEYVL